MYCASYYSKCFTKNTLLFNTCVLINRPVYDVIRKIRKCIKTDTWSGSWHSIPNTLILYQLCLYVFTLNYVNSMLCRRYTCTFYRRHRHHYRHHQHRCHHLHRLCSETNNFSNFSATRLLKFNLCDQTKSWFFPHGECFCKITDSWLKTLGDIAPRIVTARQRNGQIRSFYRATCHSETQRNIINRYNPSFIVHCYNSHLLSYEISRRP